MKLSYNWLKDYVNINEGYERIAEGLTMSGSEVGAVEDYQKDKIMELEITSNRPDCLNMIGLAREVSAVFDKELIIPDMIVPDEESLTKTDIICEIKNDKLCPLYTARVIKNVSVKEASSKISRDILSIGLRQVNNIVDITNFCLMETGQPLHAFDLDKIKGSKIIIREAQKGEKIITIDNLEKELDKGMLVIADDDGPIAIAGVMGGKRTEVTEKTKNILLESAYFDPISVRRTARRLALPTDSSYRFERGVNRDMIIPASNRAALLIKKETGGELSCLVRSGEIQKEKKEISFNIKKAEKVLGIALDDVNVEKILKNLGLIVKNKDNRMLNIVVPAFREDITAEPDVVEEIARIIGYKNIPAKFEKLIPQVTRKEKERKVSEKANTLLVGLGFQEIMTYSLVSEKASEILPEINKQTVQLRNPLSEQHKALTPNLIDGMLKSISWNLNRKNNTLALFEIGKAYYKVKEERPYKEDTLLSFSLTGAVRKSWQEKEREVDFYDLKAAVEALFDSLKIKSDFSPKDIKEIVPCASISIGKEKRDVGFAGEVSGKLLKTYGITQRVFMCQVNLSELISECTLENKYSQIPKFPFSSRDISILCDEVLPAGQILETVNNVKNEIIHDIKISDVYKGEQIGSGKKSVMVSISYGQEDRTLTEDEIEKAHESVRKTLSSKLKVSFR